MITRIPFVIDILIVFTIVLFIILLYSNVIVIQKDNSVLKKESTSQITKEPYIIPLQFSNKNFPSDIFYKLFTNEN